MFRKALILGLATIAGVLLSTTSVQAWGAAHVGYTHVGYGGVQHYGRTVAVGPYGAYSGAHYGSYGAGGATHYGSAYGTSYGGASAYHYGSTSSYGGYHYGGVTTTPYYGGAYAGGVYRAW